MKKIEENEVACDFFVKFLSNTHANVTISARGLQTATNTPRLAETFKEPTRREGSTMLVLSRHVDQEVVIAGGICVKILSIQGNRVRVGITAPAATSVYRGEIAEARQSFELRMTDCGST